MQIDNLISFWINNSNYHFDIYIKKTYLSFVSNLIQILMLQI